MSAHTPLAPLKPSKRASVNTVRPRLQSSLGLFFIAIHLKEVKGVMANIVFELRNGVGTHVKILKHDAPSTPQQPLQHHLIAAGDGEVGFNACEMPTYMGMEPCYVQHMQHHARQVGGIEGKKGAGRERTIVGIANRLSGLRSPTGLTKQAGCPLRPAGFGDPMEMFWQTGIPQNRSVEAVEHGKSYRIGLHRLR